MNNKAAGQKHHKPTKKADEPERKSFLETMPGLLTAIAALVTAIGGCIAVFVSNPRLLDFIIPSSPTPASIANTAPPGQFATTVPLVTAAEPTNTISPALAPTTPSTGTALSLPVELPDGSTVIMIDQIGNKYQYTILSAQRDPLPPDKYLLRLNIRAWTDNAGGFNFWSDAFRLVVGDQTLAPTNFLDELVNRDTTVDGGVEFEIDGALKEAILVLKVGGISFPGDTKELRLAFP